MKKKSLLILVTTCMTVGAASVLIANSVGNGFNYSNPNSGAFELSNTAPSQIDEDTYQFRMDLANQGAYIDVNVTGADKSRIEEDGIISSHGKEDFYFYNVNPIRGISSLSFQIQNVSNSWTRSYVLTFFSYNPLNLDDIFAGKYQDLNFGMYPIDWYGRETRDLSLSTANIPELVNYRYVLIGLFNYYGLEEADDYIRVNNLTCVPVCDAEPPAVEIGTNTGVLSTEEKAFLHTYGQGQLDFINEIGTSCYEMDLEAVFENMNTFLAQVHSPEGNNPFITTLEEEFARTCYMNDSDVYQKDIGTKVYSILMNSYRGNYFSMSSYLMTDMLGYFVDTTTWPSDIINNNLINKSYASVILPFNSSKIEKFTTTKMDQGNAMVTAIAITVKEGENITSEGMAYYTSLINAGFVSTYATEESASLSYDDGILGISLNMQSGNYSVMISEYIVNDEFPTAEEIAEAIGHPELESLIVPYSGSGLFSVYSSNDSISISMYRTTQADLDVFNEELMAAGYEYYGYYYQKSIGDIYNSYIEIQMSTSPNSGVYVLYRYVDGEEHMEDCSSYDDFVKSIFQYSDKAYVGQISALEVGDNPTFKKSDNVGGPNYFGTITGYSSDYKSNLIGLASSSFELSGITYYRFGNSRAYSLNEINGVLVIRSCSVDTYYIPTDSQDYNLYNSVLTNYLTDNGFDLVSNFIGLEDGDFANTTFSSEISYQVKCVGTRAEVDALKNAYSARILENTNFKYSSALDKYINVSSHFSIGLNDANTLTIAGKQYAMLLIEFFEQTYYDYQSFNELNIGSNTLYQKFVDLDVDKDEPMFVILNDDVDQLTLKTSYDIQNYFNSLSENGYVVEPYSNAAYKVDETDGYRYVFNFDYHSSNNSYAIYFYRETGTQYHSIDELWTTENVALKAFVDEFGFTASSAFKSNKKVYSLSDFYSSDAQVYVYNSQSEIDAYKDYLTDSGFDVNGNQYIKMSSDGATTWEIRFEGDVLVTIYFIKVTIDYVSWADIVTAAENNGYDYNNMKTLVPHPVEEQDYYLFEGASSQSLQVTISKAFDMDSYIAALESDERFTNEDGIYISDQIMVSVEEGSTSYIVTISSSSGYDFNHAIVVSGQITPFMVTGRETYFVFVPNQTANYTITSIGFHDTFGILYDSSRNELESNDDSGTNMNFSITYKLIEGETYYISARLLSESSSYFDSKLVIVKGEINEINQGTSQIEVTDDIALFQFIPYQTAVYYIYTDNPEIDTYGYLYDNEFNYIADNNDESEDNKGFFFEVYLQAYQTYYIGVRFGETHDPVAVGLAINFGYCVGWITEEYISNELGVSGYLPVMDGYDELNTFYYHYSNNDDNFLVLEAYGFEVTAVTNYVNTLLKAGWTSHGVYHMNPEGTLLVYAFYNTEYEEFGLYIFNRSETRVVVNSGSVFPDAETVSNYVGCGEIVTPVNIGDYTVLYYMIDNRGYFMYSNIQVKGTSDTSFIDNYVQLLVNSGYGTCETGDGIYYYNTETDVAVFVSYNQEESYSTINYWRYSDIQPYINPQE